jgi:hypothetical protein
VQNVTEHCAVKTDVSFNEKDILIKFWTNVLLTGIHMLRLSVTLVLGIQKCTAEIM